MQNLAPRNFYGWGWWLKSSFTFVSRSSQRVCSDNSSVCYPTACLHRHVPPTASALL